MAKGVADRIFGLRLALWLAPRVLAMLWDSVPDDYNNVNLSEIKAYKRYVLQHPELIAPVNEMIDFIDPVHGTSEEFTQAVERLDAKAVCPEAMLSYLPIQQAIESRTLAGDLSALDAAYESWRRTKPEYGTRQDFMWRLRIVQVGRRLKGQPLLGEEWTHRVEEAIRDFLCEHRGAYQVPATSIPVGAVGPGMVFLAYQLGQGRLGLTKELVDWAAAGQSKMRRWPDVPEPERQADALLMRVFEVVGVEFGLSDPLSREVAFFGIECFLQHAAKFEELASWIRIATVLARMNLYHPGDVAQFLAGAS